MPAHQYVAWDLECDDNTDTLKLESAKDSEGEVMKDEKGDLLIGILVLINKTKPKLSSDGKREDAT